MISKVLWCSIVGSTTTSNLETPALLHFSVTKLLTYAYVLTPSSATVIVISLSVLRMIRSTKSSTLMAFGEPSKQTP